MLLFFLIFLLKFFEISASEELFNLIANRTSFIGSIHDKIDEKNIKYDPSDQNFKDKSKSIGERIFLYDTEVLFEESFGIMEIINPIIFAKKGLNVQKEIVRNRYKNITKVDYSINMIEDLSHKLDWDLNRIKSLGFHFEASMKDNKSRNKRYLLNLGPVSEALFGLASADSLESLKKEVRIFESNTKSLAESTKKSLLIMNKELLHTHKLLELQDGKMSLLLRTQTISNKYLLFNLKVESLISDLSYAKSLLEQNLPAPILFGGLDEYINKKIDNSNEFLLFSNRNLSLANQLPNTVTSEIQDSRLVQGIKNPKIEFENACVGYPHDTLVNFTKVICKNYTVSVNNSLCFFLENQSFERTRICRIRFCKAMHEKIQCTVLNDQDFLIETKHTLPCIIDAVNVKDKHYVFLKNKSILTLPSSNTLRCDNLRIDPFSSKNASNITKHQILELETTILDSNFLKNSRFYNLSLDLKNMNKELNKSINEIDPSNFVFSDSSYSSLWSYFSSALSCIALLAVCFIGCYIKKGLCSCRNFDFRKKDRIENNIHIDLANLAPKERNDMESNVLPLPPTEHASPIKELEKDFVSLQDEKKASVSHSLPPPVHASPKLETEKDIIPSSPLEKGNLQPTSPTPQKDEECGKREEGHSKDSNPPPKLEIDSSPTKNKPVVRVSKKELSA